MASTIKGIIVSIGGDTTKLDKALKGVDRTSQNLQKELNLINKELKFNPDSAVLLAQKQDVLKDKVNATREKLQKLNEVQEQVERQAKSGDLGADEYRAYQREVEKTKSQLEHLEKELENTNDKFDKVQRKSGAITFKNAEDKVDHFKGKVKDMTDNALENAEKLSKGFEKVGDGLEKAGGVINKASAAGAAVLAGSVAAYKDLDNGYDIIVKKTGAVDDKFDSLKKTADELFGSSTFDMTAIGNAIGEVNTRFGFTDEKLKSISESYLQFAKINDADVSASVEKTARIMQAWNISSDNIPDLLGMITAEGQKTGVAVDALMDKVLDNNSTFKEMGLSLEESVGLMAQFEKNGVNDSTALAALKAAVKNATKEGKSLSEALQENVSDIKNAKSDTEALQIATSLFGAKGAAEMANAIKEGRINFDDLSGSMSDYKDTVKKTYEGTLDPLEESKKGLNNLKLAGAELANVALKEGEPLIDDVIDGIKGVTEGIKKLTPEQKKTLAKTIEIVAVAGPAVTISGKIAKGIGNIAGIVPNLVRKIQGMTGATKAAETAQIGLNVAQSASPVGALITILGLLAAAITTYYLTTDEATMRAAFLTEEEDKLYRRIDDNIEKWNELKETRDQTAKEVEGQYGYYEGLSDRLKTITDESGNIKTGYEEEAETIVDVLNDAFGKEYKITGSVIENYQQMQKEIDSLIELQKAQAQLDAYSDSYKEAITNRTQAYKDMQEAKKSVTAEDSKIRELYERYNHYGPTGEWVQTTTGKQWKADPKKEQEKAGLLAAIQYETGQRENAREEAEKAQKQYLEYLNTIKNYEGVVSAIASKDTEAISEATNRMTSNFVYAENATKEMLKNQLKEAKQNLSDIKQAYDDGAPGVTQAMVENARNLVQLAQAELKKLPDEASGTAKKTTKKIAEESPKIKNAMGDSASLGVKEFSIKVNEGIPKAEKDGKNFVLGFINGLMDKTGLSKIWNAATSIGTAAIEGLEDILGIHSPSDAAEEDADNYGGTFANRLLKNIKVVRLAGEKLGKSATIGLNSAQIGLSLDGIKNTYANIAKLKSSGIAETRSRISNINNSTSKNFNGGINVTINQAKLDTDADVERMGEKLADIIIRKGMEWG